MRIAFVALSGIRVCDPTLLRLGLSLPGFVERGKAIASLPSLGLLTLAGMTPPEHEVAYFEVADLAHAPPLPDGFDLLALSSYSAQIDDAYALAARYRRDGASVVMGGPHVSVLPEEAIRHGATAVIGHGEVSWPAVVRDAAAGRLRDVYGSLDNAFDFTDAPLPRFDLLNPARYNRLTIQTSRGCPRHCTFCAGSRLFTSHYTQKPAAKVLAEVDRIRAIWPRPFIELADDNSFIDRAYWLDLLPGFASRRMRWFTETDISVGEDDELLDALRESGCAEVLIGLESPTLAGLDGIDTDNWKKSRWTRSRDAVRNIQEHGIRVNACFVVGLDGQDTSIFAAVRAFADDADVFDVQVTVPTPFPGTPLHARLEQEGRLTHPGAWERCTLFDVNFIPTGMTPEVLEAEFRALIVDLYSAEATRRRRERFNARLWARRQHEREGMG